MRNKITLTDDQLNTLFADEFYGFGFEQDGIFSFSERSGVEFTRDTIEDFLTARKTTWLQAGHLETGKTEIGGHNYIQIEDCQAVKGQPRTNILVVDFGHMRVVYQ